jgi:hypothetical protein
MSSFTQSYDVIGMTCDHCTRAVDREIRKIGRRSRLRARQLSPLTPEGGFGTQRAGAAFRRVTPTAATWPRRSP